MQYNHTVRVLGVFQCHPPLHHHALALEILEAFDTEFYSPLDFPISLSGYKHYSTDCSQDTSSLLR